MIKTDSKDINDLLYLIRCAVKQEAPEQTDFDIEALFALARKQQVYNLILPLLTEHGLLNPAQAEEWKNYYLSELQRTIVVDNERSAVCRDLDALGIKYMYTKGLIIRNYYPKSFMRQMSDNDFLYDESRRKDLVKTLRAHGFYLGASTDNSDDFYKKPFCTFEFHRRLFNDKDEFCPDFNPFEHAVPAGEDTSRVVMSAEDNFLYTVGHMYKHYACVEGCGVRFVCDIYLLSHSGDRLDQAYIEKEIEKFGITTFYRTVLALSGAIFEDQPLTKDAAELLDFLFEGGVFGTDRNPAEEEIAAYDSKAQYLLHRIFPSPAFMKDTYKTLQEKPYLLPAYYIYRLFEKYKHNKKYMQRDLNALKNSKKNEDK